VHARSSDDVVVALHDLGGEGESLLISHATGFHGRVYQPLASALSDRFHSLAFDYRGHGDTLLPEAARMAWERFADDTVAAAHSMPAPVCGFGHSMGGACLLMAAHREPDRFRSLVVFEPIIGPPMGDDDEDRGGGFLAAGARRRRASFDSYDAALANFAAKPPMSLFDPAARSAYVMYGFREDADGKVHLKCQPENEATTYEMGSRHAAWNALPDIEVPVLVLAGRVALDSPARLAQAIADRLPRGEYLELDDLDHFGPMAAPRRTADVIREFLAR
jgi:pimeloyl-ACP methyl ester carboxylesterase